VAIERAFLRASDRPFVDSGLGYLGLKPIFLEASLVDTGKCGRSTIPEHIGSSGEKEGKYEFQ
jgi:hypothetical protein